MTGLIVIGFLVLCFLSFLAVITSCQLSSRISRMEEHMGIRKWQ